MYKYEGPYIRKYIDGFLVYYNSINPDNKYWDNYWNNKFSKESYQSWQSGNLGCLKPIIKFLPKTGKILEAGCGKGFYVVALRAIGYSCEGVEWGEKTVSAIKEVIPDLPVRCGDVTKLEVPDNHYSGYISLGVMEHRFEGPEPFLKEAYRILAPGGVAIISVPYLNMLRLIKSILGLYRGDKNNDLHFYQYAYKRKNFSNYIEASGFKVQKVLCYDGQKGIIDEIPYFNLIMGKLLDLPYFGRMFESFLEHCALGHMIMFVCYK